MTTRPADFINLDGFEHRRIFDGIDHIWQALDRLPSYLADHGEWTILGDVAPTAVLVGDVYIGEGAVVEPYAMIVGPTIIGPNCTIRHAAYIRGDVLVAHDCVIGHCSEIKSSILLPGAKVPHFNYVGDSILGRNVNLGAGTICANLRFDGNQVSVRTNGSREPKLPTGRRKLGAIIGDEAQTGCNVVLDPGSLLPRETTVHSAPRPTEPGSRAPAAPTSKR